MNVTKEEKREITKDYGVSERDTGNTKVQVALLTTRIRRLTEHIKIHKKDHHTRLGLLKLVGKRRRLLNYMGRNNVEEYRSLIKTLGLRR